MRLLVIIRRLVLILFSETYKVCPFGVLFRKIIICQEKNLTDEEKCDIIHTR